MSSGPTSVLSSSTSEFTEIQIGKKFRIRRTISADGSGDIYVGENMETKEEVVIKLEPLQCKCPLLLHEARIYKELTGAIGIPAVHWDGIEGNFSVMVIGSLGASLQDMLSFCEGKFTLKTVLILADQMITRVELLHSRNYVHRDIKPENFLLGLGQNADVIHITDFRLAKRFRDTNTMLHIPCREGRNRTGTVRYTSISTHLGLEHSRRDDLESMGYVFLYFLQGSLPWQGITVIHKKFLYEKILKKKMNTSLDNLCATQPDEFKLYLSYCKELLFDGTPDYQYLRNLLANRFQLENFTSDFKVDWLTDARLLRWIGSKANDTEEEDDNICIRPKEDAPQSLETMKA